jgi:hypothetical protein
MELKNAVAVCLISLFSATLVVLIARTLDQQGAARLEPHLAAIVEELQAIRQQGRIAASPGGTVSSEATRDGLVVYYFHSNTRCTTCQTIESQAREAVEQHFASQLARGEVVWKILNYEQPAVAPLAEKFDILMPVVVLARMKDGQVQDWRRLDEVWGLVGEKSKFIAYVQSEIQRMLDANQESPPAARASEEPKASPAPADLPSPKTPPNLPVPE